MHIRGNGDFIAGAQFKIKPGVIRVIFNSIHQVRILVIPFDAIEFVVGLNFFELLPLLGYD